MTLDELEELLAEIDDLPDSPAKLSLLHQSIAAADSLQEIELAYDLRQILIGTALETGKGDQLVVAFTWCLAQYDNNPERFGHGESELLWRFRWVIAELTGYYQVPKQQLTSLVQEMTRRYRKAGVSMRAVYLLKLNIWQALYTPKTARMLLKQFRKAPQDSYSDDPDQELMFEVLFDLYDGRQRQAFEKGTKFLSGPIRDKHEKITIRSAFVAPLVLLGETKQAVKCHETTISFAQANPRHVDLIADHMNFLIITDNTSKALKLFARSLPTAMEWVDPWKRMAFLAASTFLFERLAKTGDKPVKLRLADCFPHRIEKGVYLPSQLAKLLRADTQFLVDAFNRRNGNSYENRHLEDVAKYHEHITPVALAVGK